MLEKIFDKKTEAKKEANIDNPEIIEALELQQEIVPSNLGRKDQIENNKEDDDLETSEKTFLSKMRDLTDSKLGKTIRAAYVFLSVFSATISYAHSSEGGPDENDLGTAKVNLGMILEVDDSDPNADLAAIDDFRAKFAEARKQMLDTDSEENGEISDETDSDDKGESIFGETPYSIDDKGGDAEESETDLDVDEELTVEVSTKSIENNSENQESSEEKNLENLENENELGLLSVNSMEEMFTNWSGGMFSTDLIGDNSLEIIDGKIVVEVELKDLPEELREFKGELGLSEDYVPHGKYSHLISDNLTPEELKQAVDSVSRLAMGNLIQNMEGMSALYDIDLNDLHDLENGVSSAPEGFDVGGFEGTQEDFEKFKGCLDNALDEKQIDLDQIKNIEVTKDVNSYRAHFIDKYQDTEKPDSERSVSIVVELESGEKVLTSALLGNDEHQAFEDLSVDIANKLDSI